MNIENYSLDCFLRQSGYDQKNIAESPRDLFITPGDGASRFQRLMSHDGYSILSVNQFGDVAAINESGSEAGYYSGSSLVVHEEHRRNGLAVGMVLFAYKSRTELPASRFLTENGRLALTKAWKVARGDCKNPWWQVG